MRRIIVPEFESRSSALLRIPLFDRVLEAAGSSNDRHGTVSHAVDLRQAARFVVRWHQKNVAPGFNQVGKWIVIRNLHCQAIWKTAVEGAKHALVMRVTCAENY